MPRLQAPPPREARRPSRPSSGARPVPARAGRIPGRAALAALPLLLAAALLGGCMDGYPSDDLDQTSPFDMTNAERLRALNHVAARAHRLERSRFVLDAGPGREREPGCHLGVTRDQAGADHHQLRRGMDAIVSYSQEAGSFEVLLVDNTATDGRGKGTHRLGLLMRSDSWTHATQADLLVQLMIRDCGEPRAARASGAPRLAPAP